MKKILPLFILLALTACQKSEKKTLEPQEPLQKSASKKELKIASWNIEWLDTTPQKSYQQRSSADYQKLQSYAASLNADIIAFQEVADIASLEAVFDKEKYHFVISSRKNDQRTGFVIKKGLDYKNNGDNKALSLNGSLRNGIDISINNGESSLRLLNVHLKSYCFTNEDETRQERSQDCRKYRQQIDILDDWIKQREKAGEAYMLLGDFNRRLKRNNDNQAEIITKEQGKTLLTLVGKDDASACKYIDKKGKVRSSSEFIDHIALSNKAMDYYQEGSFTQSAFSVEDLRKYKLSDHCPISINIAL